MKAQKSKVMFFKRREVEVIDFNTPYKVSVPAVGKCEVLLGEKMEKDRVEVFWNSAIHRWKE